MSDPLCDCTHVKSWHDPKIKRAEAWGASSSGWAACSGRHPSYFVIAPNGHRVERKGRRCKCPGFRIALGQTEDPKPPASKLAVFAPRPQVVTDAIEEAVARVTRGTDPDWKRAALSAVYFVATQNEFVTADPVWHELDARGIERPREPSALGPVMRTAKMLGWLESTDRTLESERPEAHGKPQRVWRSLVSPLPGG